MAPSEPIALLSATKQVELVRSGQVSASELLDACINAYEQINPHVNAVVEARIEDAIGKASKADRAVRDSSAGAGAGKNAAQLGPLHGLPITIKDSIDVAGMASTWGDLRHAHYRPSETAQSVRQLEAAGAIVWGKTNVPRHLGQWQSFNEIYGLTKNPRDLSRSAGGSSGGSAVAVATGMASFELGSDIGGSVRWPANYNGIAGLKTSFGLVSAHGHSFPHQQGTVDCNILGPIARTVADLSLVLPIIKQPFITPPLATKTSLSEFKVGVLLDNPVGHQDNMVTSVLTAAVTKLEAAGVTLMTPPSEPFLLRSHEVGSHLVAAAFSGTIEYPEDLDSEYNRQVAQSLSLSHHNWMKLNDEAERVRYQWAKYFEEVDVLLTPVTSTTAAPHDTGREFSDQTIMVNGVERSVLEQWFWAGLANPTYLPALSLPAGLASDGMPVGLQAVGPFMGDNLVLRFGELAQDVLGLIDPPAAL